MKATSLNESPALPPSVSRRKLLAAITIGAAGGWVFFFHVQPWLLGAAPSPVLERTGFVFLLLRTFPLVILPFVCLAVALFKPHSKTQAFGLALLLSGPLLIPVPFVDEWRTRPDDFGFSPFSKEILLDVTAVGIYMGLLALVASTISAFLSPTLAQILSRRRDVHKTG